MTWLFNQEYATNMYAKELLEEGRAEGLATGLATGRAEGMAAGARETAQKMYAAGMLPNQIANFVGYGFDTVCEWLGIPVTNGSIPS